MTAQFAFDWSKIHGGIHDNPQLKQNTGCGGALTLATAKSRAVVIPPPWKKLWPRQILPDQSPEQILTVGEKITSQVGQINPANPQAIQAARVAIANLAKTVPRAVN